MKYKKALKHTRSARTGVKNFPINLVSYRKDLNYYRNTLYRFSHNKSNPVFLFSIYRRYNLFEFTTLLADKKTNEIN